MPRPSRDVLQERDHVVRAFRAAEGEQEQGVVGAVALELTIWHATDPATRH
ncbi:hypothetical protein SANTM175S_05272 [Streptomyces antimycoticus]